MSAQTRGILLMIAAMAGFAVADMIIKLNGTTMSPAHTALFLSAGGLIIFAALAKAQSVQFWTRVAFRPILLIRYLAEVISMICMTTSLTLVPLSTVGAILQATPLLVVAGAVLFLGEKVSWRRWSAIAVGFGGVLMIVQPGPESFEPSVLWAVVAMATLAIRDLTTRLTPAGLASSALASYTMMAAVPCMVIWVWLTQDEMIPAQINWFYVIGMVSFGAFGYLLLIASMRTTDVSVVSPYRYTRLIFLLLFGVVIFRERPSLMVLGGALVIIASGIYTMWRDRLVQQGRAEHS